MQDMAELFMVSSGTYQKVVGEAPLSPPQKNLYLATVGKIVPSCLLVGKIRTKQKQFILTAYGRKQKDRNLLQLLMGYLDTGVDTKLLQDCTEPKDVYT